MKRGVVACRFFPVVNLEVESIIRISGDDLILDKMLPDDSMIDGSRAGSHSNPTIRNLWDAVAEVGRHQA